MGKIRSKKKKSKFRTFLKATLFIFVVVVAGYLGNLYRSATGSLEQVQKEIKTEVKRTEAVEIEKGEPVNILLLGTDSDNLDRSEDDGYVSRSDTMIVMTLNPDKETTYLLSIPRDTVVNIKGISYPDKINHAFAYGGEELAVDTVQEFLQIPIDFYLTVNMSGLEELIDALGGIEVTSPLTFEYRGTRFKEGETREVNGVKALNFARMRYDDPRGEIGRQDRQKIVIKAMIDKALKFTSVANYPEILRVVGENIRTNADLTQVKTYYDKYGKALNNIEALRFEELEETYIGDSFYFYISPKERQRVSNKIRIYLELPRTNLLAFSDPLDGKGFTEDTKEEILRSQVHTENIREAVPAESAGAVEELEAEEGEETTPVQSSSSESRRYTPRTPSSPSSSSTPVRRSTPSRRTTTPIYTPRPESSARPESSSTPVREESGVEEQAPIEDVGETLPVEPDPVVDEASPPVDNSDSGE